MLSETPYGSGAIGLISEIKWPPFAALQMCKRFKGFFITNDTDLQRESTHNTTWRDKLSHLYDKTDKLRAYYHCNRDKGLSYINSRYEAYKPFFNFKRWANLISPNTPNKYEMLVARLRQLMYSGRMSFGNMIVHISEQGKVYTTTKLNFFKLRVWAACGRIYYDSRYHAEHVLDYLKKL